ncbi:MAG: glycogen/starch/alpha-glucan family phosphorylase [Acholeplasmatales bacterium]|jgi:starch phosphorylase|nr:glycogen/starch/alpha-glucan family phosphorylase [Acholeplasmatales bacterium]
MNYFSSKDIFIKEFNKRLLKHYGVTSVASTSYENYFILANMLKEVIDKNQSSTSRIVENSNLKKTIYFSMEFLLGRLVTSNLYNLGLYSVVDEAFRDLKLDIDLILHEETDAGLGNGGLGRLGACFLDSGASLSLPLYGNSLRYEKGFFTQVFRKNKQIELPDNWLDRPFVWETRKDEDSVEIPYFGNIVDGTFRNQNWVKAVPYDVGIVGYNNDITTFLRIWKAEPSKYCTNITENYIRETSHITETLYPDDSTDYGKFLRVKQEYFFSSAGVQNAIREHKKLGRDILDFDKYYNFQLNDTHPALVIPELMRLLMDEEGLEYLDAWKITTSVCSYTNHTILEEALETWEIRLVKELLPRIFEILCEINRRFLLSVEKDDRFSEKDVYSMRVVGTSRVRMANLCVISCKSVNGVAALHTELLKELVLRNFYKLYPNKFNNKTNGITPRRFVAYSNPALASVFTKYLKEDWKTDYSLVENLLKVKNKKELIFDVYQAKRRAKIVLAKKIKEDTGINIDVNSIFDIHVKRLHEYKRQLMNILHIIYLHSRLKKDPVFKASYYPHTFIFGAKAAPSYYIAKKVIQLINTVASKINDDPDTSHLLKVVFIPNYNVSYAEYLVPACDISEQISTSSKEASGTGNMKFMASGAVTIGTLDGANVEIASLVGKENIIIFGLNAKEVTEIYETQSYRPYDLYLSDPIIKEAIDSFDYLSSEPTEFIDLRNNLLNRDYFLVLKDFRSYIKAHEKANELYKNHDKWYSMSIVNIAKSAFFSSDRTIKEYNNDIWKLNEIK